MLITEFAESTTILREFAQLSFVSARPFIPDHGCQID